MTASYVTLDVMSSMKRFDWFAFLLFRWLRYTPALLGLILFYFLLPLLSSGPIYRESIQALTLPCERFWWRNLFYFNNFYDATGNVSHVAEDHCLTLSLSVRDSHLVSGSGFPTLRLLSCRHSSAEEERHCGSALLSRPHPFGCSALLCGSSSGLKSRAFALLFRHSFV